MERTICFAGGGTAGHLFPGLAVARQLSAVLPRARVIFAGGGKASDVQHTTAAGYDYVTTPCHPHPGRKVWSGVRFLVHNLTGYQTARQLIRHRNVSVVVGLGGYASAPMARAAADSGVPLILMEQNAIAGRATRWLARRARRVCCAFATTEHLRPPSDAVRFTGNPIRREFFAGANLGAGRFGSRPPRRRLVILGGSGGSQSLNRAVPQALSDLGELNQIATVIHQAGPRHVDHTQADYRSLGVPADVVPFIDDLPSALRDADLVISRAGGTTIAELAAAAKACVLVPLPSAADNHQAENAKVLSAAGACRLVPEPESLSQLTAALAAEIADLVQNDEPRTCMASRICQFAMPNAALAVAQEICDALAVKQTPTASGASGRG